MTEQIFLAPDVYDREIDQTEVSVEPSGIPGSIIGASQKGPAFTPYTLGSFDDFKTKFGDLDTKFMAPYAFEKYIKNQPSCVFMRVLGAGANATTTNFYNTQTKGIVVNAGMKVSGTVVNATDLRHQGAVQFLVAKHTVTASEAFGFPMFTDNSSFSVSAHSLVYLVRGVIFTSYDARIMVMNTNQAFTGLIDDAATIDDTSTNPTYRCFKLAISSSAGAAWAATDGYAGIKILTASLDPSSNNYFGKILNTDPEKFDTEKHVVYLDYAVDFELASAASGAGNDDSVVILSGSSNTSTTSGDTTLSFREAFGRYDTRYTAPKTPYFISQPFGVTEYNLFYIEGLDDGATANTKYKISIANLKTSINPQYLFGTFALLVRDYEDSDLNPTILEQFDNLTLDPNSDNYIAKIIGDSKLSFNFDAESTSDRKLLRKGKYPIKSKYVRVVMNSDVENSKVPQNVLPFGYKGYQVPLTNPLLTDTTPPIAISRLAGSGSFGAQLTGSIVPPIPYRFKITRGEISGSGAFLGFPGPSETVDGRLYWGLKPERNTNVMNSNITYEKNVCVDSFTKFAGIDKLDVLVTGSTYPDTFNNNKFTLARVALSCLATTNVTASAAQHMKETVYIRNGSPAVGTYTITDGVYGNRLTFASILASMSASEFNRFSEYTKYTAMMYGGYDGINIFDKNAYRFNDKATSIETGGCANASYVSPGTLASNWSGVGLVNNAVNSFRAALDITTDPIQLTKDLPNVLSVPGIREPLVIDYALQDVQDNDLIFCPIDIPYYNYNNTRIFDGDTGNYIDTEKTATAFESRTIDKNVGGAYFPNIVIDDLTNNRRVTVPATVAALAAISYNDKIAYPWFAPAGFNRASMDFVVLTQTRINQSARQKLYAARINPIVKFPGEGYVIFSQKTLQLAESSLSSVNVKRMVLDVKRSAVDIGTKLLFENMVSTSLQEQFTRQMTSKLAAVQSKQGLNAFKVICNSSNNSQTDIEANRMNGQIIMNPVGAVEFIQLDFILANSSVQFL